MKKHIAIALTLITCLLCIVGLSVTAAAETEGTVGLEFTPNADGTAYSVTGYTGTATEVVIPSTYRGLPVTLIESGTFPLSDGDTGGDGNIILPDDFLFPDEGETVVKKYIEKVTFLSKDIVIQDGEDTIPSTAVICGYDGSTAQAYAQKYGRTFDATHIFGAWSNYSATQHVRSCACGKVEYADHVWNSGKVTTKPTHTIKGVKTYTCSDCGATKTESVPTLDGCTFGAWSNYSTTQHVRSCACGKVEYADHVWDDGTVTIPPTYTTEGVKTYTCSDCSATKTARVPVLVREGLTLTLNSNGASYNVASYTGTDGVVVIPETYNDLPVTGINGSAFANCKSLTDITIPRSVVSIGDRLFANSNALATITVDADNTVYHSAGNCLIDTASKKLVAGCKNSVIPTDGSVTSIGNDAFFGCSNLKSIYIPEGVTSIGLYTFYHCSSLTNVTIPSSVTSIDSHAFAWCNSLASITFKSSTTTIFDSYYTISETATIYGSSSSTAKTYANNHNRSFMVTNSYTSGLQFTINEDGVSYSVTNYNGTATQVTIPALYSGLPVTSIGASAFADCTTLTAITIPNSVTSIGNNAFSGCSNLTTIKIPNSVTSIGNAPFNGCNDLTSIIFVSMDTVIPDAADTIPASATIYGCLGSTAHTYAKKYDRTFSEDFYVWITSGTTLSGWMNVESGLPQPTLNTALGGITYTFSGTVHPNGGWNRPSGATGLKIGYKVKDDTTYSDVEFDLTGMNYLVFDFYVSDVALLGDSTFDIELGSNGEKELLYATRTWSEWAGKELVNGWNTLEIPLAKIDKTKSGTFAPTGWEYIRIYNRSGFDAGDGLTVGIRNLYFTSEPISEALAHEHDFSAWSYHDDSYHVRMCECWQKEYAAHMWNGGVITTEPTHTTTGVKTYTCTACSATKTKSVDKLPGHTFGAWTKLDDTQHIRACACGEKEYADHAWNSGVITTEPTHTTEGVKTYTCSDCGTTKTESVDKLPGHTFGAWTELDDTQHIRACACGEKEYADHIWDDGKITTEPTHTTTGVKTYTCTACSATKTESVDKLPGHTFGAWTKLDDTQHIRACACGEKEYADHAWNSGVVTTKPTYTTEGVKTYTCTACSATKTETIPVLVQEGTEGLVYELNAAGTEYSVTDYTGTRAKVIIPETYKGLPVTSIGDRAFYQSVVGTIIFLSENTNISASVMMGTEYTIPGGVTIYAYETSPAHIYATQYGREFVPLYTDGLVFTPNRDGTEYSVTGYTGTSTKVIVPSLYEGNPVTSIDGAAFAHVDGLECIKIMSDDMKIPSDANTFPDTATIYGYRKSTAKAYADKYGRTFVCLNDLYSKGLEFTLNKDGVSYAVSTARNYVAPDIVIPAIYNGLPVTTINRIGNTTNNITSIFIPDTVTTISSQAFKDTRPLPDGLTLPNSVTTIGDHAFYSSGLKSITIPNSVTSLGEYAFQYCTGLTSVTFEKGCQLTSLGKNVFYGCSSLTSIAIPDSVTEIGIQAFYSCTALESVTFSENSQLKSIGSVAFSSCTSLANFDIPNGVTSIGSEAFGRTALNSVNIPAGVTTIETATFLNCTDLTTVVFDENSQLKIIDSAAFSGCSKLTDFKIPTGVTYIRPNAFKDCISLTSITIPSSVTNLFSGSFEGCTGLTSITILSNNIQITGGATTIPETATIYASCVYAQYSPLDYAKTYNRNFVSLEHVMKKYVNIDEQYHAHQCSCGEVSEERLAHTWNAGVVTIQPTHTTTGVKTYTCTACSATKTESVDKLEHTFGAWTKLDDTQHVRECACGEKEYADHTWNTGEVTTQPTHTTTGVKTYTCSDCGTTKTEPVATIDGCTFGKWNNYNDTQHVHECACGEKEYANHTYPDGKDKCTLCGHFRDGIASLYGYSISLNGDISINFYFDVAEETKNDAGAYILVTYPKGTTEKILLNEARTKTAGEVTYYVINPALPAKEINSIISARIVLGDGTEGILYEKSILGYAETLIANAASYSKEQVALMEALIAYGTAASIHFGGGSSEHQMTEITAEILKAYEIQKSGATNAGLSYHGSSVLLESETTIRHYFKLTSGDISDHTFLLDSKVVTPVNEAGTNYWYIDIPNIVSKDLDRVYVLEADKMTIKYSALSYAFAALNAYSNDASKGAMCNAVRALYEYNCAANAYFKK